MARDHPDGGSLLLACHPPTRAEEDCAQELAELRVEEGAEPVGGKECEDQRDAHVPAGKGGARTGSTGRERSANEQEDGLTQSLVVCTRVAGASAQEGWRERTAR